MLYRREQQQTLGQRCDRTSTPPLRQRDVWMSNFQYLPEPALGARQLEGHKRLAVGMIAPARQARLVPFDAVALRTSGKTRNLSTYLSFRHRRKTQSPRAHTQLGKVKTFHHGFVNNRARQNDVSPLGWQACNFFTPGQRQTP